MGRSLEERFLPAGRSLDEFVSFDLESFRPITSVTYQALHAASTRAVDVEARDLADEDDADDGASAAADVASDAVERHDFADFDLVAAAKDAGVRVVCLDEAHHLRSEWHRALKAFIKALGSVTVIALTATPPYDSTAAEWARYESLCGPVDEEYSYRSLSRRGRCARIRTTSASRCPQRLSAKRQTSTAAASTGAATKCLNRA